MAGTMITPTRLINNIGFSETVCRLLTGAQRNGEIIGMRAFLSVSYKDFSAALEMTINKNLSLVNVIINQNELHLITIFWVIEKYQISGAFAYHLP